MDPQRRIPRCKKGKSSAIQGPLERIVISLRGKAVINVMEEAEQGGVVSTDEVEADGVRELASMSQETCDKLTALLPPMAVA
jgi:hypothetical protein